MAESNDRAQFIQDDGGSPRIADFLKLAKDASDSGDAILSMHLYLAAFRKSAMASPEPNEDAINGLKRAWSLACGSKERSMAEYIFELMEPFLSKDEVSACAEQLQSLAFDKLAEIGLSRGDLEEMAEAISEEIASDYEGTPDGLIGSMFTVMPPSPLRMATPVASSDSASSGRQARSGMDSDAGKGAEAAKESSNVDPVDGALRDSFAFDPEGFNYSNLAGYSKTVTAMRDLGVGVSSDPAQVELVNLLNTRHGLTAAPAPDSMLFRSDAREDANRFAMATVGEMGVPAVHMRMEESFQASPILCISTYNVEISSPSALKRAFASGGVLMLENIDLWESPVADPGDDGNPLLVMQMTRGAREAIGLIRSAVDNPDVTVLATASATGPIDEFFLELLEPLTFVDISLPDEQDRLDIWMDISRRHPSMRQIDKAALVKYSANMARFDIYMAAREAVEEAYKLGLACKRYMPIGNENIFDKLACYQPLESEEYSKLEDEVIAKFRRDIEDAGDLLLGGDESGGQDPSAAQNG